MKLLEKIKGYKTKRQLREEIAYLKGTMAQPVAVATVERNVRKMRSSTKITDLNMPVEYAKRDCLRRLADTLEPLVEWDVFDDTEERAKVVQATLYVAERERFKA